ncbi:hypothetical protein H8S90_10270 [Olivibacter sp. SDN3]|uniref:hypothetical protein n=1 Tax=Olivibacter sp. SDN3 TaxID=2764720 RepID=UPI001650E913|nr:hypothetical protein [Olivibacter sp. SDN3]QNL51923.1 hypothetical protein H8S90_10270 [Olivibacter sp. SDN3]
MENLKRQRDWMPIPTLSCIAIEETLSFWEMLGYKITYKMTHPYQYGVVERNGYELHFARVKGMDVTNNDDGCLVMVSDARKTYKEFAQKLKENLGRVPHSGIPRISRMKPEATRFTLMDVSGNCVIFILDDEKDNEVYEKADDINQTPLQKSIATGIRFRDFKEDEKAAAETLDIALQKVENETLRDIAEALLIRMDLANVLNDFPREEECRIHLSQVDLPDEEKEQLAKKHGVKR